MMKLHKIFILCLLALLALSACGVPHAGLMAEYPTRERDGCMLFSKFKTVETLTPTLRWQTIGQVLMEGNERNINRADLTDISYELRIWETETGYSGRLVYSRLGIATPYHTLEEPMKSDVRYLWTVRAHFKVDGKERVSEWGMTGFLLQDEPVPNPSCFRFKTRKGLN